ncbi:MAG: TonB-dependent receptor [Rikenellaceae bacterium]
MRELRLTIVASLALMLTSVNVLATTITEAETAPKSEKRATENDEESSDSAANKPLYVINGNIDEDVNIDDIPSGIITNIEVIKGEDAVEKYGQKGSNGVILISLRYDTSPLFSKKISFHDYIIESIKWEDTDPVARVIFRYKIKTNGTVELIEIMESTDSRMRKRIVKAVSSAPKWERPAKLNGKPVETISAERIQLPLGKRFPGEIIIR